jgi:hypothetical protein
MKVPKEGDRYRVKSTRHTREFGLSCGGAWADPFDKKLWPKDIGTICIFQGNGWTGMKLAFERGRTLQVGTLYSEGEWEIDEDRFGDLVKMKEASNV